MPEASPTLELTRTFRAPVQVVWDCVTRPALLAQWFGPFDAPVSVEAFPLAIGARWHITLHNPEGGTHGVGGTVLEVQAPHRLVYSWSWDSGSAVDTRVQLALSFVDGITTLQLTHDRLPSDTSRDRHMAGWTGSLARLAPCIADQAA